MQRLVIPLLLLALWLALWATDTGVLVFSRVEDVGGSAHRACYYLIGPSIERDSWPAMYRPRCRLLVRI